VWTQNYDPLNFWPGSTFLAALPVIVLLGLLASGKANAWVAALAGLLTATVAAVFLFKMPVEMAAAAATYGVVFALFRIVWLIVAAVFLYDIAVATGQFDIMKASIARLSGDRRIQAVLVAFSFGAFIEGAAGFGAPVAISAAFLVGLGFKPFQAALLCLIANTAPVAWGAIGTPIRTLAAVTSLDVEALSATSGRILPIMSLIIPFWLVKSMASWKETFAVWPALVVVGGSFAGAQFFWSNYVSFELVDIVSAVASLLAGVILMKFWKPKNEWRFDHDGDVKVVAHELPTPDPSLDPVVVARAWMPFVLLSIAVLIWGAPSIKRTLDAHTSFKWEVPGLHEKIYKGAAITGHDLPTEKDLEKAVADIVPITSTGTAVFLAAIVSGFMLGLSPLKLALMLYKSTVRLIPAIVTIICMLALGFVTKSSGMDVVLGLAFTRTNATLYPILGTLLGWLGVALTGSDTSSNVLFGNLQKITATKLGLNPILMASANTTGGVMGKMIDAQSIVVAAAATGEGGKEGDLLKAALVHSIALALLVGLIVWTYAHILPGWVVMPKS
jgi:lactate permease